MCSQIDTIIKEPDRNPVYYRDPYTIQKKVQEAVKEKSTILMYKDNRLTCA